jgi:hypothetical protein
VEQALADKNRYFAGALVCYESTLTNCPRLMHRRGLSLTPPQPRPYSAACAAGAGAAAPVLPTALIFSRAHWKNT